jgi:hypothetical protein
MVALLLELTEPSGRPWMIGQPVNVAARDAAHLLMRVVLLCACATCA